MRTFSFFGVVLLFGFVGAGTAMAQCASVPSTQFCLNGLYNSNALDGIYVSPYTAIINNNGVSVPVICDDFYNDVTIDESWTVSGPLAISSTGAATSGLFGSSSPNPQFSPLLTNAQSLQGYEEVAYLSQQLIQLVQNNPTLTQQQVQMQGSLSYAIWAVFDNSGVTNWLTQTYHDSTTYDAVFGTSQTTGLLAQAQAAVASDPLSAFSNVSIYTPTGNETPNNGTAQEFVTVGPPVGAAEAPAAATLAIDFLGLGALFFVFRRQRAAVR